MIGYLTSYLYLGFLVLIPAMVLTFAITELWAWRHSKATGRKTHMASWYVMVLGLVLVFVVALVLLATVGLSVPVEGVSSGQMAGFLVAFAAFLALVFAPVVIIVVLAVDKLREPGWT